MASPAQLLGHLCQEVSSNYLQEHPELLVPSVLPFHKIILAFFLRRDSDSNLPPHNFGGALR